MEWEVVGGRSPVSKKDFVCWSLRDVRDRWVERARTLSIKSVFRTTSRNKGM